MLNKGQKAPGFSLQDKDGKVVSLQDYTGKKVVLYFYPKDDTPGCTIQAQKFRDMHQEFVKLGIPVIGISKDSVKSHANFCKKYDLPFTLLSDEERTTLAAYEVLVDKLMYGKPVQKTLRTTFLIDETGRIEHVWEEANPDTNATDILAYLKG